MDGTDVRKEYLNWLCRLVDARFYWHFLWWKLHSMAFVWILPMDENRAEDGKSLRYLYSLERVGDGVTTEEIDEYLAGPCTVLEFLVGLARRIENDIMYDAGSDDDRTSVWFWEMVQNLGLDRYDDEHYDDIEVDDIVTKFMSRKYNEESGNIFKVGSGQKNMQLWDQAQAWCSRK